MYTATVSDKVQVGDTTKTTTTGTSTTYQTINPSYNAEKGWECPRCGRINAPWVRQCDCSRNNVIGTWDKPYEEWWKQITCSPDTFRVHPESNPTYYTGTIGKAPSSICKVEVNSTNKTIDMNSCTSVDSPWHKYATPTSYPNSACEAHD